MYSKERLIITQRIRRLLESKEANTYAHSVGRGNNLSKKASSLPVSFVYLFIQPS